MILMDEGYEAMVANNGDGGYMYYLHFEPDLVITDIQMPVKNGFELIKLIRHHNPKIRPIYMSGNLGQFELALREEKSTYHACLLKKPFSRLELIKSISKCSG
jgi:YesN/AraC family two-component response regulator